MTAIRWVRFLRLLAGSGSVFGRCGSAFSRSGSAFGGSGPLVGGSGCWSIRQPTSLSSAIPSPPAASTSPDQVMNRDDGSCVSQATFDAGPRQPHHRDQRRQRQGVRQIHQLPLPEGEHETRRDARHEDRHGVGEVLARVLTVVLRRTVHALGDRGGEDMGEEGRDRHDGHLDHGATVLDVLRR